MAYTLPKSRRGSYAIPKYVQDEGLERHAFVTLQAPDGTFDNPKVGAGGYVVPKYVLKDPIGQGVSITKWAPRGTYYGQKIPYWMNQTGNVILKEQPAKGGGTAITLKSLGDYASSSVPFQQYGNKVASLLMGHVSKLPAPHRKAELKRVMNAIDPSLWNRAAAISSRNVAAGMSAARALHAGIARAAATGIHAEVIHTGRTRILPTARSLMGMGCYGCEAALGALNAKTADIRASTPLISAVAAPAVPADGTCSADGNYIWHGTWMRIRVGEVCKTIDSTLIGPTTHGTPGGGISVDFPLTKGTIQAGPFFFNEPTFDYRNQQFRIEQKDAAKIPQSWLVFIKALLGKDSLVPGTAVYPINPSTQPDTAASYAQWFQLFGATPPPLDGSQVYNSIRPIWNVSGVLASMPVATYAIAGKDFPMLVRISLATRGSAFGKWNNAQTFTGPLDLLITTYPPPQGGISMPTWLAQLPTEVHAAEIIGAIADLGCGALKIAGQTSKDPAVQAGAAIGQAICGAPQTPSCPYGSVYDPVTKACVVPAPKSSILPVAIAGAAAVAGLLILRHRRKRR